MCKKDYFIALYDKFDNYITYFNSIKECAKFLGVNSTYVSECICRHNLINTNYYIYKIIDCPEYNFDERNDLNVR